MDYTQEQIEDFKSRQQAFEKEFSEFYVALKEKHLCELVNQVATVPTANGTFTLGVTQSIGDLKYRPTPSPLSPEDVAKN